MIASLSLGSDALMKFKKKVKKEKEQIDGSNNNKPTYICFFKGEFDFLTKVADFDQQECSKKKKCNKPVLEILLRHGDILIQFGSNIQNNWLHSISADGFRIAATARLIDASLNGKLHEPHTKKKKKLN
ncbi:hypothetical protein BY996DRAFT_6684545 [Phakopsora pachyrhizi]|nr:hypothetical protein BY996DRAFT_6684545 [Phakopsora pachyrhizi]